MLPVQSIPVVFHEPPVGGESAKLVMNTPELVLMIFSHLDVKALSRVSRVCRNLKSLADYHMQGKIYRVVRTQEQLSRELFQIYRTLDLSGMTAICCASESNDQSHILIFMGNSQKLPLEIRAPGAGARDPTRLFQLADHKFALLAKYKADFQQDPNLKTFIFRSSGTQDAKIELLFLNTISEVTNEPCFVIDRILEAVPE